jgi:DNA-directed RNA polymerase specialized sigma subunit
MMEYSNSQISEVIDEWIHSKRDRDIMKSRLIDGLTHEKLAEEYDMSVRQIKRIIYKNMDRLSVHI